jgi:D-alanine-D-alanine ligase
MKKLRILVLMHEDLVPPETLDGATEQEIAQWKTEFDVLAGLHNLGHEVRPLGVATDLSPIVAVLDEFRPHITFNLLEEFQGVAVYDYYVVSYLELMRKSYTGCNPRGLMLAHDKALSKKVLAYHRVSVPRFTVFPINRRVRRPPRLQFPLLVKSLTEEGSVGITQASVVHDDRHLERQVHRIHHELNTDAIAEFYVDGREFYVGILGNQRLQTLPVWELEFRRLPEGEYPIATTQVKWDEKYQKQVGVETHPAELAPEIEQKILRMCKRCYRLLNLTGYARMDLRLSDRGEPFFIEANPNPQLAYGEDFAESAEHAGLHYEQLLHRIVSLGLAYRPQWRSLADSA